MTVGHLYFCGIPAILIHGDHMTSVQGKWALVTGASSGIGPEFAHALAEKGAKLVLVARRTEPMQRLAQMLRDKYRVEVRVEGMDLSLPDAADALKGRLDAAGIDVDILINNAGVGVTGEFTEQSTEQITTMLRLNIVGLTALTHVFAAEMKARGGGHILLLASVAAYQPSPLYAAYAATKAYVLSLGVALHAELAPHRVVVTVLSPGVTDTGFFDAAGQPPTPAMQKMMMKPRPVVDIGLAALFQEKSSIVAGAMNRLLTLFSRVLSRDTAAMIAYKMTK
jgi:short-subunit dehydrogenase